MLHERDCKRAVERSVSSMTFRNLKPYKNRPDRAVQIRSLLRDGATVEQIAQMGFPHMEITAEKLNFDNPKNKAANRNTHERKVKNPGRCKECGGLGEKHTFTKGICMACVCRERTNYERKGRWRV